MSGFAGCSTAGGGGAKGILPTIPVSYDGDWLDGRPMGLGTLRLRGAGGGSLALTAAGGSSIEGVWTEEGLIHGKEKLLGKGGVYEGKYRLGKREGHGRLDLQDGSEYEGMEHLSHRVRKTRSYCECCSCTRMTRQFFAVRDKPHAYAPDCMPPGRLSRGLVIQAGERNDLPTRPRPNGNCLTEVRCRSRNDPI